MFIKKFTLITRILNINEMIIDQKIMTEIQMVFLSK